MATSIENFDKQKENCFSGIDLSKKGSIDTPIVSLVKLINEQPNYFTTSSCSGRIIVFEQGEGNQVKKKGCKWLFTSHDSIDHNSLVESLSCLDNDAVFKFEPLVLHIQCRTVEDAQKLHACSVASGFRNSGITIGTKGKIIMAVRSTHSFEVPLSKGKTLMVSNEYLKFLTDCANTRMRENVTRIERFHKNFQAMLLKPAHAKTKKKGNKTRNEGTGQSGDVFPDNEEGDKPARSFQDNKSIQCVKYDTTGQRERSAVGEFQDDIGTDLLFDDT